MDRSWEFRVPPVLHYGRGCLEKIGEEAKQLGSKALVIGDAAMERLGYAGRCGEILSRAGVAHTAYLKVDTEPTDRHVEEACARLAGEGCDLVIGLGGGSPIDTAKAVSVTAANGGGIADYFGDSRRITRQPVPVIAVPTTAGTGSEVTDATVITHTGTDVKMMIKHPAFCPAAAIVDPALTDSSPPKVTAATGIDALCHAVEAYLSRRAHPMTDPLALRAVRLIGGHLHRAYQDGSDREARDGMAVAATLAGMAFSNASVCLVHGMSRPIGAVFHVPHGISNAMLLPAVMEFSREACVPRLAEVGRILNDDLKALSDSEAAEGAVEAFKRLCVDLAIPNLSGYGLEREAFMESLDKMAADALASGSPGNNPRIPDHGEIVALYRTCYDYNFSPAGSVRRRV